jgi:hypothetical protein
LSGAALRNPGILASLSALRELRLARCKGIKDISFVRNMKELRALDIRETAVSDLKPLGGLASLVTVDAYRAPIQQLPSGPMPSLRTLKVIATKLSPRSVATFEKTHPNCQVWHRWDRALKFALASVTRLSVRTGGICCRDIANEETLIDENHAEAIKQLVQNIKVDELGGHCACCGTYTLEFYRGDELVHMLSLHHAVRLRWPGNWPGDGELTLKSGDYIFNWLAERGLKQPKMEWDARTQERRRRWSRWILPVAVAIACIFIGCLGNAIHRAKRKGR